MKLNLAFAIYSILFNFIVASDLMEEILLTTESTKKSLDTAAPSAFNYNFQTHDCPKKLSEVVYDAVNSSISEGRLPILVCDIDETLIKMANTYPLPTDFYKYLSGSGTIEKSHGVLALTARIMAVNNILDITHKQLAKCTPEFAKRMCSDTNLDGLASLDLSSLEKNFLYNAGLIVMGYNQGNLTKRQILEQYLQHILVNSTHKYDLIFIDNSFDWFSDFCNGITLDSRITKGHFFHYAWDKAEGPKSFLSDLSLARHNQQFKQNSSMKFGLFKISDLYTDADTDSDTDTDSSEVTWLNGADIDDEEKKIEGSD